MLKKIKSRIILIGPQGSGKSTQSQVIANVLDIVIIATGDILREEIKQGTELGEKLKQYVNNGLLAPDELIIDLMISHLPKDSDGFLLDGFPRDLHQAKIFHAKQPIDHVFNIEISDKVAVDRIIGRRMCPNGHLWHIQYRPTKQEGICDICGEKLRQRQDDQEEIVRKRLSIYRQETSKLLDYYKEMGKLVVFNGEQAIEQVSKDIFDFLNKNAR